MEAQIVIWLLITGCGAGFIAGLLGVGGGLIVVPITLWALGVQNIISDNAQHIAIGTSFGVMVFTTFMSMFSQHKRRAINWHIVKAMLTGIAIGTLFGSVIASHIPSQALQILFIVFCYLVAVRTFIPYRHQSTRQLPPTWGLASVGSGVGVVSSLLGIGGGVMNVPFLLFCNVPAKNAVGISAAITFFIAIFGAIGYVYSGWSVNDLPPYSLGYINLPITATLTITAIFCSPLGVKVSHQLPEAWLKKAFGVLMLVVATRMLLSWL